MTRIKNRNMAHNIGKKMPFLAGTCVIERKIHESSGIQSISNRGFSLWVIPMLILVFAIFGIPQAVQSQTISPTNGSGYGSPIAQNQQKSTSTSSKNTNAQRKEQILIQLNVDITSFLNTIQSKREQNQQHLEQMRTGLAQHQAKKTTRKTQATDEQIEQMFERKIANLENKEKEYKKMEEEAFVFQSTIQSQLIAIADLNSATKTNQQKNVAQPSRKEQILYQLDTNLVSFLDTVHYKREQNQQYLGQLQFGLEIGRASCRERV